MADIELSIGFAFNRQDLNNATEQLEKQFSNFSVNPEIAKAFGKELNSARGMISGFQRDVIRELSKIDLSSANIDDYAKIVGEKLNQMNAPIIQLANRMHEFDNSFDPKPFLDYFNTFQKSAMNFSRTIFQVSQAASKVGYSIRLEGNPTEQIDSIIASLEKFSKEADSFSANKFEKSFISDIKNAEQANEEYAKLTSTFLELNKEWKRLNNERLRAKRDNASDNEQLAIQYQLRAVQKERLETALKISAIEWSSYSNGDSFFTEEIKDSKDFYDIINNVDKRVESLGKSFTTLAGDYGTFRKAIDAGIELPLLSERNAKNIANTGVIDIDAKIRITTSPDEIWDSIKEKLQEVQQIANEAGATTVPIKIEGVDKEAQQVIQDIITEFEKPENKIPIHLDLSTQEIDELNNQLKKENLEGHINIAEELQTAQEKAKALKDAFSQINEELLETIQKREDAFQFDSAKYTDDSLAEEVRKAQNRALEAITELNQVFKNNPVFVEFDINQALANLEAAISTENLTGKIDITKDLKQAGDLADELVSNLRNIENIDFKSNFVNSFDIAQTLDYIELIYANLSSIVEQLKSIQQIQLNAPIQEMKFGIADEVLPYIESLTEAMRNLQSSLGKSFEYTSFSDLESYLVSISDKTQSIQRNINSIKISEKVINSFKNLQDALNNLKGLNSKSFSNLIDALERLDDVDSEKVKATLSSFRAITKTNVDNISAIAPALTQLKKELDALDKTEYTGFLKQIEDILKNAEALKSLSLVVAGTRKQIDSLSRGFQNIGKDITSPVDKIKSSLAELDRSGRKESFLPGYQERIDKLNELIDEFEKKVSRVNSLDPNLLFNSDIDSIYDLQKQILSLNTEIKEFDKVVQATGRSNAIKKITKFLRDSSKLTQEEREQLDALIARLNNPNLSMTEFKEIMASFNQIETSAIKAGRATSSFFDAIRNKLKYGWAQTFATFFSFYDIIRYIREVSSTVTELNGSLIELAKVSEASIGELYNDFSDFASIAKETGGTVNDIIKMTSDWARNGYNLPDSKELARISSIFQNIGDGISSSQANEYLVSTLKGFRLEAESAMHVIDVINNVSNNAASGVSDIGEALERSSSALGAANTSLEKSVALLTTANEILQNPETVGTAFKSMAARLRAADTEIESLEDGFTMTTSKLRDLVMALTEFDIQATEDSYKDIYDILLGISQQWETLSDIQKASLSEELFGKRNSQVGFAILQNGERLQEIYALAQESEGSALAEQEKYLQGVTYQIDRFKASVESLSNTFMSADFLKGTIKVGTDFINLLDDILDKLGAVSIAFGAIGAALSAKGFGLNESSVKDLFGILTGKIDVNQTSNTIISSIVSQDDIDKLNIFNDLLDKNTNFTDAFESSMSGASSTAQEFARSFESIAKGSRNVANEFVEWSKANQMLEISQLATEHTFSANSKLIKMYNSELKTLGLTEAEYISIVSKDNKSLGGYLANHKAKIAALQAETGATNMASASMSGYAASTLMATVQTIAFKAAAMAGQMILGMFVGFLVSKLFTAFDNWIHKTERLIDAGNEAKETIRGINDSLKSQQKTVQDSAKRFAELSQGVDQLTGKNLSLSDEDYQEFLDISNELAEVFPSLTRHYDENGNAIVDLDGNVNTIVSSLNELLEVEQQIANQKILENFDSIWKGLRGENEEFINDLRDINAQINQLEIQSKSLENGLSVGFIDSDLVNVSDIEAILEAYDIAFNTDVTGIHVESSLLTDEVKSRILQEFRSELDDLYKQANNIQKEQASNWSQANSYIDLWLQQQFLKDKDKYTTELQTGIKEIVANALSDSDNLWLKSATSDTEVYKAIQDNVLNLFDNNEELAVRYQLSLEAETKFNNDEISVKDYQNYINDLLPLLEGLDYDTKKAILLSLGLDLDSDGNIINTQVNNLVNQLENSVNEESAKAIAEGLTKGELEAVQNSDINWAQILNKNQSLDTQIQVIKQKIASISQTPFEINLDAKDLETATSGIKELQSTYQTLYEAMQEGKEGSDLAFLMSDIEGLKEKLVDAEGNTVDLGDTWNNFFDIMTDGSHSFEEMEDALNQVLTAYVNSIVDLENFDRAQADAISTQLQLAGVTKESADAYVESMTEIAQALELASDEGYNLDSITAEVIDDLVLEGNVSEETGQKLALYALQKKIANGLIINTDADIYNIQQLMAWANLTSDSLQRLITLKKMLSDVESGKVIMSQERVKNIENAIEDLEDVSQDEINAKLKEYASLKHDQKKAASKSKSGGSSKESDPWKEAYEKELAALDHLHEMELISDEEYYKKRSELNEKYFANNTKYAEDYAKNEEEIYKGLKQVWQDSYSKELTALDRLHDRGLISDFEYYNERKKLNEKYYANNKVFAEDYAKNEDEIYKGLKEAYKSYIDDVFDYYEKALDAGIMNLNDYATKAKELLDTLRAAGNIDDETYYTNLAKYYGVIVDRYDMANNAAQRLLKQRMEALEDEKDALEESYKLRKDAIQGQIDAIQSQIDITEKEIEKLEDANKARQEAIDLQKALYEMNRAENQRSQMVYNSEQGFVYRANQQDIKNAQEEVENLRYQQRVSFLQNTVDTLNEQIDGLKDQIDSLDEELDKLTEGIDKQIDALQKYADRFGEISNKWKESQEDMVAATIWGSNWQTRILDEAAQAIAGTLNYENSIVQAFQNQYVQAQINQANATQQAANYIMNANASMSLSTQQALNEMLSAYDREIEGINKLINALKELEKARENASSASSSNSGSGGGGTPSSTANKNSNTTSFAQVIANNNANAYAHQSNVKYTPLDTNKRDYNNNVKNNGAKGATVKRQYTFGKGTKNAPFGIHEIAEDGNEIVVDNYGHAFLAQGHQLHKFEGGERVYNQSETNELLKGKYISIDSLLPDYQNMLEKVSNIDNFSYLGAQNAILNRGNLYGSTASNNGVNINIGDIHLSEVNDVNAFARAITNQLPNALLQEIKRR